MKKPYTVIVMDPDHLAHNYGTDNYLAHVLASSTAEAETLAQKQSAERFNKHGHATDPDDFSVIAVFLGHLTDLHESPPRKAPEPEVEPVLVVNMEGGTINSIFGNQPEHRGLRVIFTEGQSDICDPANRVKVSGWEEFIYTDTAANHATTRRELVYLQKAVKAADKYTANSCPMKPPLVLDSATLCIGKTKDSRAVWKNTADGRLFISVHDAKGQQHLLPASQEAWTPIARPCTRGSLDT